MFVGETYLFSDFTRQKILFENKHSSKDLSFLEESNKNFRRKEAHGGYVTFFSQIFYLV